MPWEAYTRREAEVHRKQTMFQVQETWSPCKQMQEPLHEQTKTDLYPTIAKIEEIPNNNDIPKGAAVIVSNGQRGAWSEQKPFEALRVWYWGE